MTKEVIVVFDAHKIHAIQDHCNSYAIMRNAMIIGVTPVGPLEFSRFCDSQAKLLEMTLGAPSYEMVKDLYQQATQGQISIGTDMENVAFREQLGTLLGLWEIRHKATAKS